MFFQKACCRHVGAKHAFLDQFMRIIPNDGHDLLDLALVVEKDSGFNGIKVDGAARITCGSQSLIEGVEFNDVPRQLAMMREEIAGRLGFWLVQKGTDLGVRQAGF